jgi:hypothetical protein
VTVITARDRIITLGLFAASVATVVAIATDVVGIDGFGTRVAVVAVAAAVAVVTLLLVRRSP